MSKVIIAMCRHGAIPAKGITGGGQDLPLTAQGEEEAKQLGHDLSCDFGNQLVPIIIHSGMQRTERTAELAAEIAFPGKTIRKINVGQGQMGNMSPSDEQVLLVGCPDLVEIHHGSTEGISGKEREQMWNDFSPLAAKAWKKENPNGKIPDDFTFRIHPQRGAELWNQLYPNEPMPQEFAFEHAYKPQIRPINGAETWDEVQARIFPALNNLVNQILQGFSAEELKNKEIAIAIVTHNAVMQRVRADWQIEQGTYPKSDDGYYRLHWQNKLIDSGSYLKFQYHVEREKNPFEYIL